MVRTVARDARAFVRGVVLAPTVLAVVIAAIAVVLAFLLAGPGSVLAVLAFGFLGAMVLVTFRDTADLLRALRDGPAARPPVTGAADSEGGRR